MPPTSIQNLPPFASTSNTRLNALYSDISRQKRSNPTSYHANVNWWQRALESIVSSGASHAPDAVHANGRLILNVDASLMDVLKVGGVGKPLGLGAVIDELRASKAIIPLSHFLDTKESIYDPGWLPTRIAAYVVGKPLWWTLEQLGIVGEDGLLSPGHKSRASYDNKAWWGKYLIVSLVERAADSVIDRQHSKATCAADNLYSLEGFKTEFGTVLGQNSLDDDDALVMLKFLERDLGAVVMDHEVIKFVSKTSPLVETQVSAVDRGILELKTAITNMHTQIESLHSKMDEYTRKASEAIRLKHKAMALSYLRSRKLLEDLSNKRLTSLNTLESTMISVEAAAGDIEIMRMYESSTATLHAILAHPSLRRESIDQTLDALAEANTDAKEIDDAVRIGADVALNAEQDDDETVEMELNKLIEEATLESNQHRRLQDRFGDGKMEVPREEVPGTAVEAGKATVPSLA